MWKGLYPPQAIFSRRRFEKVVLDPPEFKPGYWCGAGKLWLDREESEYWLTSRPRAGSERRGYAAEIYRSKDGADFKLSTSLSKEEVSDLAGERVQSIENQQLLRDPLTGRYHLYLSLDVQNVNVAGQSDRIYESRWETFLLSAEDPSGPWEAEGFVIRTDRAYDSGEARDATIDIVDGRYIALYKARRRGTSRVNMALAVSADGKRWEKRGVPSLQGKEQPPFFLLNGTLLSSGLGPVFVGIETAEVVKGAALSKLFVAYLLNLGSPGLERVFVAKWAPGSPYEHPEYPIHTYSTMVEDTPDDRWLMMIEAVDPTQSEEPGLNKEVDRVLLYTSEILR